MSMPRPRRPAGIRLLQKIRLRQHAEEALRRHKGQLVAFLVVATLGLLSVGAGLALLVDRWAR